MCLAVPGEILTVDNSEPLVRRARVRFGGIVKEISLALLPEAQPGEYVLVHAGVGISVVNEREANRIFEYLEELGELEDLREASP